MLSSSYPNPIQSLSPRFASLRFVSLAHNTTKTKNPINFHRTHHHNLTALISSSSLSILCDNLSPPTLKLSLRNALVFDTTLWRRLFKAVTFWFNRRSLRRLGFCGRE